MASKTEEILDDEDYERLHKIKRLIEEFEDGYFIEKYGEEAKFIEDLVSEAYYAFENIF